MERRGRNYLLYSCVLLPFRRILAAFSLASPHRTPTETVRVTYPARSPAVRSPRFDPVTGARRNRMLRAVAGSCEGTPHAASFLVYSLVARSGGGNRRAGGGSRKARNRREVRDSRGDGVGECVAFREITEMKEVMRLFADANKKLKEAERKRERERERERERGEGSDRAIMRGSPSCAFWGCNIKYA
ncbi:hypothetical protein H6P81_001911 [Aristolochia fimbriata]|uniref:Uncharacterized protein n=1 Tax=Aristolochia fimbriata TaxID=158543 RepID=A0AAV7F8H8_ARIFI|nr:hypothetical protein H6P81_001911 [Aristolochia fimbriata]